MSSPCRRSPEMGPLSGSCPPNTVVRHTWCWKYETCFVISYLLANATSKWYLAGQSLVCFLHQSLGRLRQHFDKKNDDQYGAYPIPQLIRISSESMGRALAHQTGDVSDQTQRSSDISGFAQSHPEEQQHGSYPLHNNRSKRLNCAG